MLCISLSDKGCNLSRRLFISVVTRFVVISVSKIERYRMLIFKLRFIAREFAFYHLFVHALNSDLSNAIKKKLTPLDHRL